MKSMKKVWKKEEERRDMEKNERKGNRVERDVNVN